MAEATKETQRCRTENIKTGDVFSRHSFGTVVDVDFQSVTVKNTEGWVWTISKDIVENEFHFAEHIFDQGGFTELSRTELIKKIMAVPYMAMTIVYHKKPDMKKAAETLATGQGTISDREWKKTVTACLEGEQRLMKGYHVAEYDEHGRLKFIEVGGNGGFRLVDPRTITSAIFQNVHYQVKK